MIGPIAVRNFGNGECLDDSVVRIFALWRVIAGQTHARYANFSTWIGKSAEDDGTNLLLYLRE